MSASGPFPAINNARYYKQRNNLLSFVLDRKPGGQRGSVRLSLHNRRCRHVLRRLVSPDNGRAANTRRADDQVRHFRCAHLGSTGVHGHVRLNPAAAVGIIRSLDTDGLADFEWLDGVCSRVVGVDIPPAPAGNEFNALATAGYNFLGDYGSHCARTRGECDCIAGPALAGRLCCIGNCDTCLFRDVVPVRLRALVRRGTLKSDLGTPKTT